MERVIKFRAWDSHNKVMITPYAELRGGRFWGEDLTNTGYAEPLPEHVMQFTGLTDKNGKEIYEGDIVRKNTGTAKPYSIVHEGKNLTAYEPIYKNYFVVFYRGAFCLHDKPNTKEHETSKYNGTSYAGTLQSAGYDIELIGNIYENPELLK